MQNAPLELRRAILSNNLKWKRCNDPEIVGLGINHDVRIRKSCIGRAKYDFWHVFHELRIALKLLPTI